MKSDKDVMIERRLEEAAMNAWPASQVTLLDGWVLRFAGGYTKRANSINPTYPSVETNLLQKLEVCEAMYARKGLPSIVRLTSFGAPEGLDELLIQRDYRRADESIVMKLELDQPAVDGLLESLPVTEWLDEYVRLSRSPLDRRDAHLAILERISGDACFGVSVDQASGRRVACGLAVTEGAFVGLFDIMTDPELRGRGYGTALVRSLLAWASRGGATAAYLQVVAENAPAIALYRKLGFEEAYRYWYRIPPVN